MRSCLLMSLALLGLSALPHTSAAAEAKRAADADFAPAAVVRVASLDSLIDDARYLSKQARRDELARHVEAMLTALTGKKGLRGVDPKKPLGAYGTLAGRIEQSQVMLLLPVADQRDLLAFVKELGFVAEKKDDDSYKVTVPAVPFPVLFRFAHGYVYATLEMAASTKVPAADQLPLPETVLGTPGPAVSVKLNLDRVPEKVRKLAVMTAEIQLENLKDQKVESESEKQGEFRHALLDEAMKLVKKLGDDGGPVSLDLSVDQKAHDVALSLKAAGKPDSALAKELLKLGGTKSLAGLVGKDSALGGHACLPLPEGAMKPLAVCVDEAFESNLGLLDEKVKKIAEPLTRALARTAKRGTYDAAVDLRGPGKGGAYAVVAGVGVVEGRKIEAALKEAIATLPEEMRKPFDLDADKSSGVAIHRVRQANLDKQTRQLFGDGSMYFALKDDALIVTLGEDALGAMKAALATTPRAGGLMKLEASLSRLAPLIASQRSNAAEAAKAAFTSEGGDKVSVSLTAGDHLALTLRLGTAVLDFAARLDAEKKADAEDE